MHEPAVVSMMTLAQGRAGAPTGDVLLWVGVLIAMIMGATIAILIMRKRLLAEDTQADSGSFMDELREARNRGEITPEEFDATRARLIEKMKGTGPDPAAALRPKRKPSADLGPQEQGQQES
jgi:hypothetical protein